jgi:glycosyltransferase involved in cell wall biosynthesis
MIRVAHMIDLLDVGGAQQLQVTFAGAARAHGIDTTVISLRMSEHSHIPSQLRGLGAGVHVLPAPRLFHARRLARLAGLLRRERFDVLHTHLTYANILGALVGRLAGIPVVATLHSAGADPVHGRAIPHLERLLLRYSVQRVVAVGPSVAAAHAAALGGRALDVLPNAVVMPPEVPAPERRALRAKLAGDPLRPLVIAVGRLTPLKGYADMLEAFQIVLARHPDARLLIAGDGELRAEIAGQIAALELGGQVTLLGSREDVPRLLAAADVYLHASHLEGLPVAVLEAMAAGLPIVATSVGDTPEVLGAGAGLVVPPRQPAALAGAVAALLDNPDRMRALGATARARVAANYGLSAWMERLNALYREMCARCEAAPQEAR